ncbi:hypothetical protein ABZT02_44895 [Streptomyces sp. NPDC005402]|uniref:hypothetical protein n=1 Tax=Streptomyces sp. NPDC005402 TaxID=3155338 RepID=UPI0033BE0284
MPDPGHRPPRRLAVRQAAAVLVLAVHGTAWLVVALIQPSLPSLLTCLSAYGAALATLALFLTTRSRDRN